MFYTYDQRLLLEKKFIERLDSIKKLIRPVLIPKFVYISSLLPIPKEFVKELNQILFNFLWKGPGKVTRVLVINEDDKGGLKMTDVDSIVMSLRLAWYAFLVVMMDFGKGTFYVYIF